MEKRNLITQALIVKSLAHDGYRRAGLAFNAGENTLAAGTITHTQLAMLEADPRLALLGTAEDDPVTQVPTAPADDTSGAVVQTGVSDGVAAAEVNEQISLITAMSQLEPDNPTHFTNSNKPQVDALAQLVNRPVTASQRDDAWADYQRIQAEQAEKGE